MGGLNITCGGLCSDKMVSIMIHRYVLFLILCLMLSSCQERVGLAPVVDASRGARQSGTSYTVNRYDTLYAIAFRYDKDYRTLAALNHLSPPYKLYVGQHIHLRPVVSAYRPTQVAHAYRMVSRPQPVPHYYMSKPSPPISSRIGKHWTWPTKARQIITYFSPSAGQKGIDIVGHQGDKIYAANHGVIAYAGDGLNGYGNLIIIKHDNQLLTAYAHNARNIVREGQRVRAGDVIADMGRIDRRYWGLHFEMRQWGKPVNPLYYLQKG